MFVDNCSAHTNLNMAKITNIKIEYFPPNLTCILQPLDLGIIYNFKCLYRTKLLETYVSDIEKTNSTKKITVLDAIKLISIIWNEVVKSSTIINCFKKAKFEPSSNSDNIEEDDNIVTEHLNKHKNITSENLKNYINIDKNLSVTEEFIFTDPSISNDNAEIERDKTNDNEMQIENSLTLLQPLNVNSSNSISDVELHYTNNVDNESIPHEYMSSTNYNNIPKLNNIDDIDTEIDYNSTIICDQQYDNTTAFDNTENNTYIQLTSYDLTNTELSGNTCNINSSGDELLNINKIGSSNITGTLSNFKSCDIKGTFTTLTNVMNMSYKMPKEITDALRLVEGYIDSNIKFEENQKIR